MRACSDDTGAVLAHGGALFVRTSAQIGGPQPLPEAVKTALQEHVTNTGQAMLDVKPTLDLPAPRALCVLSASSADAFVCCLAALLGSPC